MPGKFHLGVLDCVQCTSINLSPSSDPLLVFLDIKSTERLRKFPGEQLFWRATTVHGFATSKECFLAQHLPLLGNKSTERLREFWGEQVAETYTSRSGGCFDTAATRSLHLGFSKYEKYTFYEGQKYWLKIQEIQIAGSETYTSGSSGCFTTTVTLLSSDQFTSDKSKYCQYFITIFW